MDQSKSTAHTLFPFAFRNSGVLAVQFLGELDSNGSTFAGLPTREEPFSHRAKPVIPDPPAPQIAAPPTPLIEIAVLVPTPLGGVPAFPGDWIVQDSDGIWSVYPDEKFRAGFESTNQASADALSADGSGTGRYGSGDNWTQHGDGTDYPADGGSFGVPQNKDLKPFEAFTETGTGVIVEGSSFRVLRADKTVDPNVYVATKVQDGVVTYENQIGMTEEVSRDQVVPVKA